MTIIIFKVLQVGLLFGWMYYVNIFKERTTLTR